MICTDCGKVMTKLDDWRFSCSCGCKKTLCEVYSRVVGYIRPTSQWNDGKQAEFKNRLLFDLRLGVSGEQTVL